MRRAFKYDDMLFHATEAWGAQGRLIVERWREYNKQYFGEALRPVPLVITHAQPFGNRLAFCSYDTDGTDGRTITLNLPSQHRCLVADCNVLLHEMIHQFLFERNEDAAHKSAGWRREIMRLHLNITGHKIWAGRYKMARDPDDWRHIIRINEPAPDGRPSLTQREIASWPIGTSGINLGHLDLRDSSQ